MDPITMGVNIILILIKTAREGYDLLQQIKGETEIPSWDDLLAGNTKFQAKIDAEKEA